MTIYESLQQLRLEKIQNNLTILVNLPDIDDKVEWKKLWKQGIEIEATYIRTEHWTEVKPKANGGTGHTFTHAEKTVYFRRRK